MRPRRGPAEQRRMVRLNRPPAGEPFVWFTREMMTSAAWRGLSEAAWRVLCRVVIEHTDHGGTENGNLPVTYDDFERYGIRRKSIKRAVQELVALGWIDVVSPGRSGSGIGRCPATYALCWLPTVDGAAASNRWKAIQTKEDADAALRFGRAKRPGPRTRPAATATITPIARAI
jgi:hypothetical protein